MQGIEDQKKKVEWHDHAHASRHHYDTVFKNAIAGYPEFPQEGEFDPPMSEVCISLDSVRQPLLRRRGRWPSDGK